MSCFSQRWLPPYKVFCWLKNDAAVLVYDRYDIWKLDPDGIKPLNKYY